MNNLTLHLKELEKEEQTKPKVSSWKEIIKVKEEINKIETLKNNRKDQQTNSWFFEKINKIDKHLARLTKKKRERTQINKMRNERGEITSNILLREYYDQLYANKLDNLGEMDKFLET